MTDARKSKILEAARSVFLRYGYKRVSMNDLAEAVGVSRPALYLLFRNKEEIFTGVFLQWIDETIADVIAAMATAASPRAKVERAFDVWAVRSFEMTSASPEAQELIECSFGFAAAAQQTGYAKFEAVIAPVLASRAASLSPSGSIAGDRIAHVLASAVRGFKLTATTATELRELIGDLLALTFGTSGNDQG